MKRFADLSFIVDNDGLSFYSSGMIAKKFVRSSASALLLPFFVLCSVFEKRERGFGKKNGGHEMSHQYLP